MKTSNYRTVKTAKLLNGHSLTMSILYSMFSNLDYIDEFVRDFPIDADAKKIVDVLLCGYKKPLDVQFETIEKTPAKNNKTNTVVVAFSGGKDSLATVLKLQETGRDVVLFHVKGINKGYPDETQHVLDAAAYLNLPLHIETISQGGATSFKESPIKNQLIASLMLDYAISQNIGTSVAFGDFLTDNIHNSQFYESWSDTQEMWEGWLSLVRTYVPNVELLIPFGTYNETLDLISDSKELLSLVHGCILPYRFRAKTKAINESKYDITLLDGRCGSCWKCCTEYIYLVDKGVVPLNEKFYRHCLSFLRGKLESVRPDIIVRNERNAYEAFLHRDFAYSILNR